MKKGIYEMVFLCIFLIAIPSQAQWAARYDSGYIFVGTTYGIFGKTDDIVLIKLSPWRNIERKGFLYDDADI